jgi:hypothetical protein
MFPGFKLPHGGIAGSQPTLQSGMIQDFKKKKLRR